MSDPNLTPLLARVPASELETLYSRHGVPVGSGHARLEEEIRLDGSNTLASLFRGIEGVPYQEVARDVGRQLGVRIPVSRPIEEVEQAILSFVAEKYWESLNEEERRRVRDHINAVDPEVTVDGILTALAGGGAVAMAVMRPVILAFMTELMVQLMLRYGAKEAAKQAARVAGLAVPGLNILLGAWTVVSLAGPAFRKTVPTVIEISLLRLQYPVES